MSLKVHHTPYHYFSIFGISFRPQRLELTCNKSCISKSEESNRFLLSLRPYQAVENNRSQNLDIGTMNWRFMYLNSEDELPSSASLRSSFAKKSFFDGCETALLPCLPVLLSECKIGLYSAKAKGLSRLHWILEIALKVLVFDDVGSAR